jgi:hypothetical protein
MRILDKCLTGVILCVFLTGSSGVQHPIPPVWREADKRQLPDFPPPSPRPPKMNPAQLKHEPDELAQLANAIPSEIEQTLKGEFPKQLNENLKQIEKLSKRLRKEVSP